MSVNPAQLEAISVGEGPAMVLAGPGSGKTTVITHRVRRLIRHQGVDPSQILVITFTKAAALQMQERFFSLMDGERPSVTFGTFHAVFFKILRIAYNYNANQIIQPERRMAILREALAESQIEVEEEGDFLINLANEISAVKGEGISLENYYSQNCPAEDFRRLYHGYEKKLHQSGLLDFDDMVGLCFELFSARPDILKAWQKKYQYILIDEFQDINRLQYEVVRMLALPENNLFIVGDDDQSIYRFRGAHPEIMLGFPKDYPGCRQIHLDINYRSTPQIVETANRLIGQNETRFRKTLRANGEAGEKPVFRGFANLTEENDCVLRELSAYHSQGIPWGEMAILFRTNSDPRALVEQLMRMNLPFRMKDVVPNLYDHWIAGDLITYMIVAAGSRARGDILRIINRPKRYIARGSFPDPVVDLDSLKKMYQDKEWVLERLIRLDYDLKMIAKMRPYAAINYIRRGVGYDDFLREYAEYRKMKPDELLELADELQESSAPFQNLTEWLSYISNYREELKNQKEESRKTEEGISLVTMHGAKGLEYQVVYILDANEGITPHKRAALPAELEEERRLFYVAMTRAKKYLHIYWTKERYHKKIEASRFVKEAGYGEQKKPERGYSRP